VIAAAGDPPGQGDGVPGVLSSQRAGMVGAHHRSWLLDLDDGLATLQRLTAHAVGFPPVPHRHRSRVQPRPALHP
jgi:hypothetical protein